MKLLNETTEGNEGKSELHQLDKKDVKRGAAAAAWESGSKVARRPLAARLFLAGRRSLVAGSRDGTVRLCSERNSAQK